MASHTPGPGTGEAGPESHLQVAQERLYNLIKQKETALAEYQHQVELSRATHGYFDPYHLEAEEWLDVAHSKWKQVEALQKQYKQDGITLIPRKPLTRLEQHQQQLQQSMQCPPGSTCSISIVKSDAHTNSQPSPGCCLPASPHTTATADSQTKACKASGTLCTTAGPAHLTAQATSARGVSVGPSTTNASCSFITSSVSLRSLSSKQHQHQVSSPPTVAFAEPTAASSVNPRPMSPPSSKLAPSRLVVSSACNAVMGTCANSRDSQLHSVSSNRSPLCSASDTSTRNAISSSCGSTAPLHSSLRRLDANSTKQYTVLPTISNRAAAATTAAAEKVGQHSLQDSSAARFSNSASQITARHALLQHLATQQQLWEAEWQRVHSTPIPAALCELLLQPVLQIPRQIEERTRFGPADLRDMLLKPGATLEKELRRQRAIRDLDAFSKNTARMGATQAERAKQLYSMLMYSPPEHKKGLWAQLCSMASSYSKERQLRAEQYRLADDLDVMFMREDQLRCGSDLRSLVQWLGKHIPFPSAWYAFVLLWSSVFNTWVLLNAKAYSWRHRRRMAWTGYPTVIGQTRGNGALRQFYENLDQRFVDDEPGHLGLTGLVMAGILPYLEGSTWSPVAIACRLQSAVAADYKWQRKVWQLEHPGVPFVYIETPRTRPGAVWATEAWSRKPPAAGEEDIQLAKLVAQHGSTFSEHQLSTALAIYRGVDSVHFDFPSPTLLQLANMHALSEGTAAPAILRLLLDAEDEQYLLEIEDKRKDVRKLRNQEWKLWMACLIVSIPLLGRLITGRPHEAVQLEREILMQRLLMPDGPAIAAAVQKDKEQNEQLQLLLQPTKPADLVRQFLAKQSTRQILLQQEEELLLTLERTTARKAAAFPPKQIMHHLALHCTGGDNPNVWLARQQRASQWRRWAPAAVTKVAAAALGLSNSSSSSSFPAVDDALATAAIQQSKRTSQPASDVQHTLGTNRTAEDLHELQPVSNGDGWWDALEVMKQRMQNKQARDSSTQADQVPLVSTAALAAAKFTRQEAKATVAAEQALTAAVTAAIATVKCNPPAAVAAAAAATAADTIHNKASHFLAGLTQYSTCQQPVSAMSGTCQGAVSFSAAAAAASVNRKQTPGSASEQGRTANVKPPSSCSTGQLQAAAAADVVEAALFNSTAATAIMSKTPAAVAPRAAAALASPVKHVCSASSLGPGSVAAMPIQRPAADVSAPQQVQTSIATSRDMLATSSELRCTAEQLGSTTPNDNSSSSSKNSAIIARNATGAHCTGACNAATAAAAAGKGCLKGSSRGWELRQDTANAMTEGDPTTSNKELLSSAGIDVQGQMYSVAASHASCSKAASASCAVFSEGAQGPASCSLAEPDLDAISTSRAASFTSFRDIASTAGADAVGQNLHAEGFASRLGSFSKLAGAAGTVPPGVQSRASSFSFISDGKATGKGPGSSYASRVDSREAGCNRPGSKESGLGLADKASSREGSFTFAGTVDNIGAGLRCASKAGSREASFTGLAASLGSITAQVAVRTAFAGVVDSEPEFEEDYQALSDASLRVEGSVVAE